MGRELEDFYVFFSNQQDDMGEIQISGDNLSRGLKINHHIPQWDILLVLQSFMFYYYYYYF